MSCDLAQEMWSRMETTYSETAEETAPVLWSKFYGSKFRQGQSVMEFMTEVEQTVSRLRAIEGIVITEDQITTQVLMSLPSSLKLNFVVAWDSTPAQEKTLRNLTTRLVKLEKSIKQSEEENSSNALISMRGTDGKKSEVPEEQAFPVRDNKRSRENEGKRKCWECGDETHVRARCRIFKRRLEKEKEEEDRDRKRRRYDPPRRGNNRYDRNSDSRDRRHNNKNWRDDNRGRREHSYSVMHSKDENNKQSTAWYADSGATQHMTDNRGLLINFVPVEHDKWTVSGIGEAKLSVAGQGDVNLHATVNGKTLNGTMRGVLYVPGLGINLYSIGTATDAGVKVLFSDNTVSFSRDGTVIMEGRRSRKEALYYLDIQAEEHYLRTEKALVSAHVEPLSLWHQRLGHLNYKKVLKMASLGSVKGLALFNDLRSPNHCEGCLQGKMCRAPFSSTRTRTTRIGHLIHSDVCGPMEVMTPNGERYYVVFKDDHSDWCEVTLLKQKSEAPRAFKNFSAKMEAETNEKVKALRSDGGGEFCSNEFRDWLKNSGIAHHVTPPYTPQLNGVAERSNRTIVESARSQMYGKRVSLELWGLAVQCAVYVQNRTSPSASSKTPYEQWYKKKPDISHLRVFGCRVFVHVPDEKRRKLDPKAIEGMMVGYVEESTSCYKVGLQCGPVSLFLNIFNFLFRLQIWNPVTRKITISRDVIFEEDSIMKSEGSGGLKELNYYTVFPTLENAVPTGIIENVPVGQAENNEVGARNPPDDAVHVINNQDAHEHEQEDNQPFIQPQADDNGDGAFDGRENPPPEDPAVQPRRSLRTPKPTEEYRIFRGYISPSPVPLEKPAETPCSSTKIFGKQDLTAQQALSSKEGDLWRSAMDDEYASLMENKTWELVQLPPERKSIKCRWVFDIKPGYEGVPERYKARLVALGCSQQPGIDFNQTFAPVVKLPTLRLILALVAAYDLEVLQLDVKTAFLHGRLDEEIYISQPEGYVVKGREKYVCKLLKSLYGLKQAPRAWNIELNNAIIEYGLVRSEEDQCVYYRVEEENWILATFFVDDGLICGTSKKMIETFVDHLKERFELRTLPAGRFLGITIHRDRARRRLSISQPECIDAILKKFKMEDCNSVSTPAEPGLKLSQNMSPKNNKEKEEMKQVPYKEAVGALLYISTTTRPDISYAVGQVAKFNQNPGIQHWKAVKRIFRYLAGTRKHGIFFSSNDYDEEKGVIGYTDADHAGDLDDRTSTSGCVFICHGGSFSWFSRKQSCTSLSTTEAEFVAGGEAAKEATWIRAFLKEINRRGLEAIPLFCDNQGAIRVANNPELHRKMKHVELRFRFVQQAQKTGVINARYIDSRNQVADIFTKALPTPSFQYLRQKLGVMDRWEDVEGVVNPL